ncbi:hypothetical protein N4G62_04470 [Sphingomonas sanguinis]|uniref:Uncharacterized protein n=1 Tax=Sphingomonas sanguinis TaxID=33051 RepID=A0ABU5LMW9_9SPHN|nr:hypothetical protein [Sphingomonas sanguinis]MDZ7281282.1 hypothetical protein [Sphingomonas sanguinis]
MLMPHDLSPPTADRDALFPRILIGGGGGLLLVGLACLAMGPDGTLAMLLFLYLIGLAIVLRAVMAPAAPQ